MATSMPKAPTRKARARQIRTTFQTAKFDARPDRLDFRDLPYTPPLRSLAPCWPADDLLRDWLPRYIAADLVLDQGQEGACTGFGLACVSNHLFWLRHLGAQTAAPFEPVSPRMLYELARRYDEWQGDSYDGSSCRGALKGCTSTVCALTRCGATVARTVTCVCSNPGRAGTSTPSRGRSACTTA
jgi:hypothetical protein